MVLHSVSELIQVVGSTYGVIDIRCVAIREGALWRNVLAVLRLTYEDVPTAQARLRSHLQKFKPVKTESLTIDSVVRPFSDWTKLCSELKSSLLLVGELQANLFRQGSPIDLDHAKAYFQWANPEMRPFDNRNWPELRLRFDPGGVHPLSEGRFVNIAHLAGYADAFEAANYLCEVNVSQQNPGADVSISIPVFATISTTKARTPEKCIDVELDCHKGIENLEVISALRGPTTFAGEPFREQRSISDFSADEAPGSIVSLRGSALFGEVRSDDWLQVRLTHPEIGEITRRENAVRMLIAPAERNILLEAVKPFLKEVTLDDLLVRAYDNKPPKLTEGAGFELHASWLLSLFGFSTILLGHYEHIIAPHTKVRRSSVDILAASQRNKVLLVVGCTLIAPEVKDFGNLRNARNILERGVFQGTGVSVIPVLFTCATGCPSYDRSEDSLDMLPIIDADQMQNLLEHLRQGEEYRFLQFLVNPSLNRLGNYSQP
jgi:hypothetical protein